MKFLATVILLMLFAGCATSSETEISNAVSDYIKAAELEERDSIRTMGTWSHHVISQRYATLETKKENFLQD